MLSWIISKKKFRRLRAHRSSDSDSDADGETSRSGKLSQGESSRNPKITEWEHNLRVIFPTTNTIQIRAAVAAAMRADNLEAGVDYLISGKYTCFRLPYSVSHFWMIIVPHFLSLYFT